MGHTSVERGHEWRGLPRACCRRGVWPDRKHAGRGDLLFRLLDSNGQPLTGAKRYTITFTKPMDYLEPVSPGFWSVTMYDGVTRFTAPNPIVTAWEAMTTLDATRTAPYALLAARQSGSGQGSQLAARTFGAVLPCPPQLCACTAGSHGIEKSGNLPRPAASYAGWLGNKDWVCALGSPDATRQLESRSYDHTL
jgi:hypothetical protein